MKLIERLGIQRGVLLAMVLLVSALVASTIWTMSQQSDLDDAQARRTARVDAATAARQAVPELLSYSAATLDRDVSEAQDWLTAGFRKDFSTLQDSLIEPAVEEKGFATTATVARLGVVEAEANVVTLLVFVEQTTQRGGDEAEPIATRATVRMERIGGRWLVGDLRPV